MTLADLIHRFRASVGRRNNLQEMNAPTNIQRNEEELLASIRLELRLRGVSDEHIARLQTMPLTSEDEPEAEVNAVWDRAFDAFANLKEAIESLLELGEDRACIANVFDLDPLFFEDFCDFEDFFGEVED